MRHERHRFNSWVGKIPWRRAWQPNSSILARKIPWTEEPGGLHSWSHQELDTTEATWHTRMQWGWGVKERQFEPGVWCFSHLSPAQRVTKWNLPDCSFADARTDGGWREPPILEQVCSIHSSCWCNKEFLFRSQWQEWTLCLLGPPYPHPLELSGSVKLLAPLEWQDKERNDCQCLEGVCRVGWRHLDSRWLQIQSSLGFGP